MTKRFRIIFWLAFVGLVAAGLMIDQIYGDAPTPWYAPLIAGAVLAAFYGTLVWAGRKP